MFWNKKEKVMSKAEAQAIETKGLLRDLLPSCETRIALNGAYTKLYYSLIVNGREFDGYYYSDFKASAASLADCIIQELTYSIKMDKKALMELPDAADSLAELLKEIEEHKET